MFNECSTSQFSRIVTKALTCALLGFQWDFVSRTFGNLIQVPPSLRGMSKEQRETWSDCVDRSTMSKNLILDTQPGMLDMMTEASYPNQGGEPPVFGAEILAVAREL